MIDSIQKTLAKEEWRNELFPSLLVVVERLPTWQARAAALNEAGLTTYHGKPWTRGNVQIIFHSYWSSGSYSWNLHREQIDQLRGWLDKET